jgi:acyl carrier protein
MTKSQDGRQGAGTLLSSGDKSRLASTLHSRRVRADKIGRINAVSLRAGAILGQVQTMTRSAQTSVESEVISVLKAVNPKAIDVTPASDLVTDLGFDSLQIMEVIAELEDRFDVSIPLNDMPSTRKVSQIVARVTALVDSRADR